MKCKVAFNVNNAILHTSPIHLMRHVAPPSIGNWGLWRD